MRDIKITDKSDSIDSIVDPLRYRIDLLIGYII